MLPVFSLHRMQWNKSLLRKGIEGLRQIFMIVVFLALLVGVNSDSGGCLSSRRAESLAARVLAEVMSYREDASIECGEPPVP